MLTHPQSTLPVSPQEEISSRLVFWLGAGAAQQLAAVDGFPLSEVALPLIATERRQSVLDQVQARGLGLFLDPEPWRNQLPPTHLARRQLFAELDYSLDGGVWNPKEVLSTEHLDVLPSAWLSAQIAAGATELMIPGHIYYDHTGKGRQNDLLLAQKALETAEHGMLRAGAPDGVSRRLYVQLNIWPFNLRNRDIVWLADAYAELSVDGYWLNLVSFTQSETQYMGIRALVNQLTRRTASRVVVAGLGRLWPGALVDGISSVCFGHERSLFSFPPPDVPFGVEERRRSKIYIYHPAVLGAVRMGQEGRAAQCYLFERFPCDCGGHRSTERPLTYKAKLHHNAWWTARELEWASAPRDRVVDIQERIDRAAELRRQLGMAPLSTAWREIARSEQVNLNR